MLTFLKSHPFAVEAYFESSVVVTYAVPKEQLLPLIPECLELDTYLGKWAFLAVALVQTKDLRPKGFPKFMGNDFLLAGYRIFVRYTNRAGKRLRGLYILKSETDSKKMELLGNLLTQYKYSQTDVSCQEYQDRSEISSINSKFKIVYDHAEELIELPEHSPFADWAEARRYAGPLPFTFSFDKETRKVLIIEGVRQNWKPRPLRLLENRFDFLQELGLHQPVLANAFIIRDIPYHWKKGKTEIWKP
ncbi:MAG: DUF2071 domain-containing protein [Bacteroidota bacterium]